MNVYKNNQDLITIIARDEDHNPIAIDCQVKKNWHGIPMFELTLAQFKEDHPDLRFDSKVYNEGTDELKQTLSLNFLSPNRLHAVLWVRLDDGVIVRRTFNRDGSMR